MKIIKKESGNDIGNWLMKSTIIVLLAFGFYSCDDNDNIEDVAIDEVELESEAVLDGSFEDLDDIVSLSMATADAGTGGRVAEEDDDRIRCAQVTHNEETNTIVIDFGEGCEDPRGNIRTGKIVIHYTGRRFVPGSIITATLENFTINGIQIEGTRVVENISDTIEDAPKFAVTLTGGKITWEDGTFATREVNQVRTWIRAANPLNDEFHVEGTANGINREGRDYTITIIERLIWKRRCHFQGVFLPVSGVKEVIKGDQIYTIDFGDGECDNIITVTFNGRTQTINVDRRGD